MSEPRVAVVTGASRGIGRAVAHRLAGDGLEVHALGRDREALRATAGGEEGIRTAICDVTDPDQVSAVLGAVSPVDILVNNAGAAASNPLRRTTLAEWEQMMAVNATGAFLCTREVVGGMTERHWGRVVTVASVAGLRGAPYIAAYTASKHAVVGLMRAVAAEVASTGVTANSVCPTYVRTEMTERTVANIVAKTGMSAADAEARLTAATPLGRLVEPAEVAHAVAFLVTDEAAAINGQSIVVDGGGIQT